MIMKMDKLIFPQKGLVCLIGLFLSFNVAISADKKSDQVIIKDYVKQSFAPVRGENFSIQVEIQNIEYYKNVLIEIRSSDDDLIRTLAAQAINQTQSLYDFLWDGKDNAGELVPNEAYYPLVKLTTLIDKERIIDPRIKSGGEEVFDFEKQIRSGSIEYTLPTASRMLIRSGIKNGPMLRTIVDWEPRTAGFHVERWNGMDDQGVVSIEKSPKSSYLILGYQLPDFGIITYANSTESYRTYRERKKLPLVIQQKEQTEMERNGKIIRPEFYNPVLQQKSPRISVLLLNSKNRKALSKIKKYDEILTEVNLHDLDEKYLNQQRYEISFFIDNEFIAEEEQGFVPFTWRWSPGRQGIKPGKHILTVNVSGYSGQVGVKNIPFQLIDE